MKLATLLYSGGKDSHYLLYWAIKKGYKIPFLINLQPLPSKNGELFFNHPYSKKIIQTHSKLLSIPIIYYKMDFKKYKLFKKRIDLFIKELIDDINIKSNFVFLFTWDRDDIKSEPAHIVQYKKIMSIKNKNIKILFPFKDKSFKKIVEEYYSCSIEPICVGMSKINGFSEYEKFLGRKLDINFVNDIDFLNRKSSKYKIESPDIQTVVIKSPLFKKQIRPLGFKKYSTKENVFYKISKFKLI